MNILTSIHIRRGYDNGISLFHDDTVNGDDTINTSSTKTKLPKVAEVIDKFMVTVSLGT